MESTDWGNRHNNDGGYPPQPPGTGQETLDIYRRQIGGGESGHVAHPASHFDLHQQLLTGSGLGGDYVGSPPGADPSRPELGQFSRQLLTNPSETMHPFGNAGVLAGGSEHVASLPYLAGESEHVASLPYLAGESEEAASAAYPPPQDFQGIQPLDLSLSLLSLTGDHTHFGLHALVSQTPPAFSEETFAGTYGELPDLSDDASLLSPTSASANSIGTSTVYGDLASSYGTSTVYSDVASSYLSPEGFPGSYASPFAENQLDSLVNSPAYPVGTPQAVSGDLALPYQPSEGFSGQPVSISFSGNDIQRPYRVSGKKRMSSLVYKARRRKRLKATKEGREILTQDNSRGSKLRRYRYNYAKNFYPKVSETIHNSRKAEDILSVVNAERAKKNEKLWTIQELNTAAEEYASQREQEKQSDA